MQFQQFLADDQIIALYFAREETAIGETGKKYGYYLLTIAKNILVNSEDSEECVNDTYLKAWNAMPPTQPRVLRAFLAKITRHTAFDRYDEANRLKRIPPERMVSLSDFEGIMPDTASTEEKLEAQELGHVISAYLETLSDRRLYIFLNRFFYVMPIANIAKKLGCSQSTVHKELAAMKQELRQKLRQEGYEL